ncbi:unnamed protein product [Blepharisma stoltei]|uniref:DNA-directed RNA polymerase III subunit RPC6 n=1 Tax=Blepharisma stoltei TaxID=1481888 RepID=A0AAU9ID98_9CILI|nr:unnamed protein product [Blepharisma stoltei]
MESLILNILEENSKLKNSELDYHLSRFGPINESEKVAVLNTLIGSGQISITDEDGEVAYHYQSEEQAKSIKSLLPEENLILQIIREAGNKGVWNQEIKAKTEIPIAQINKILKNLEKQGLVYSVKSVQFKNRTIWLLKGVEPNKDVTGGFLFSEQEFDRNKLGLLISYTKMFLQDKPGSLKEISAHLKQRVDKDLTEQDIKEVVNSLLALHEIEDSGLGKYTTIKWAVPEPLVIPCIGCPLQRQCHEDGVINPAECEYLSNWLDY